AKRRDLESRSKRPLLHSKLSARLRPALLEHLGQAAPIGRRLAEDGEIRALGASLEDELEGAVEIAAAEALDGAHFEIDAPLILCERQPRDRARRHALEPLVEASAGAR